MSDLQRARLRDKALVAEFCLRLEAARDYGFVTGGPTINVDVCAAAILEARDAGITYTEDEIDAVIRRELVG